MAKRKAVSKPAVDAALSVISPPQPKKPVHRVRLIGECIVCGWPGSPGISDDDGRPRQWATVEHDLCTSASCIQQYKEWSRSGELERFRKEAIAH